MNGLQEGLKELRRLFENHADTGCTLNAEGTAWMIAFVKGLERQAEENSRELDVCRWNRFSSPVTRELAAAEAARPGSNVRLMPVRLRAVQTREEAGPKGAA